MVLEIVLKVGAALRFVTHDATYLPFWALIQVHAASSRTGLSWKRSFLSAGIAGLLFRSITILLTDSK